MTQEDLLFI